MHEEELEYAGFWVRVGASLIDSILIILVTYPVLVSIYGWNYFLGETGFIAGSADFLITWVLPAVAIVAFWKTRQATPGKILISAKIVDADSGLAPSTGQCIGRYLAYIISHLDRCTDPREARVNGRLKIGQKWA